MPQNPLLKAAVALILATTLAGCYAYPAGYGYQTYGYQAYSPYPAYAYGGYPYGGYPGAIFIGGGDGGYRHHYDNDGGHFHGFNGRPGPGFSHASSRPGGFPGGFHPGGPAGGHH